MYDEMEKQIGDMSKMVADVSKGMVQVACIAGITALGVSSIIIGGDLALTVVTAVAASMGGIIGWLFPSPVQGGSNDKGGANQS
jgi:predicted Na+-dependent transporter